jgi:hypothetical protein
MTRSKNGYYSTVPRAKPKAVADKNPVGSVTFGAGPPKMVPEKPGTIRGLGEKPHPHHYGHGIHQRKGHLRVSLHPNAHQVGFRPAHGVIKTPPARAPHGAGPIGKHGLPKLPKLP